MQWVVFLVALNIIIYVLIHLMINSVYFDLILFKKKSLSRYSVAYPIIYVF